MLITIYDKTGRKRATVSPSDSSTQTKEIQGDNVLSLSFTTYEHIDLDVDDYVEFEGERYWQTERYRPKQKSEREWEYDLKLYGVESMIKRLLVIKTVDGEDEPVFTLTAPPREHVAMIVRCMNNGMGNITDWKTGQVDGTENIVIDYFGKYCDEALKEIAEKVGVEWWVEGQTVNVCRCEHGEQIALGYRKGLLGLEADKADNVKFYTRLYPVGSSRNIDPDKYGFSRLQLPDGKKYVEINADKYGRVDHYEQDAFAGIYPRRIGKVSEVRFEEKTGEDGKPFKIYYFKDDDLAFDPNDYELGGMVKRVSFQEGSELAGLGDEDDGTYYFEVNFDSDTREFEIITIWPYDDDTQLPGDMLIPKKGDGYILWNIRMPDEYYRLAEEEFLTAVETYNEENALDVSVFKSSTDHVWIEDSEVDLFIGRRVRLESEEYFPETGYRESRITKITRKVNLPSSMDIEIGDALSRTSMQKMNAELTDTKNYAKAIGDSISLPDIIRTQDNTKPTDNNIFSAKKTLDEALSRKRPDTASKLICFLEGAEFGSYVAGYGGAKIDASGDTEVGALTVRKSADVGTELAVGKKLTIGEYIPGATGGVFYVDTRGEAHIETSTITVNKKMTVKEVEIQEQTWVGGAQINSPASMRCYSVETIDGGWRCYFLAADDDAEIKNEFRVGDLARCQVFNLIDADNGVATQAISEDDTAAGWEYGKGWQYGLGWRQGEAESGAITNRYYWRRVIGVSETPITNDKGDSLHYIDLSSKEGEFDPDSTSEPMAGDRIITVGNDTDSTRANVIIASSYGEGSPYLYQYQGINTFSLSADKLKTRISPYGNKFTGQFFIEASSGDSESLTDYIKNNIPGQENVYSLRPSAKDVMVFHRTDSEGNLITSFTNNPIRCFVDENFGTSKYEWYYCKNLPTGVSVRYRTIEYDTTMGTYKYSSVENYTGQLIYATEEMRYIVFYLYINGSNVEELQIPIQTDTTSLDSEYRATLEVTEEKITAQATKTNALETRTAQLQITANQLSTKVGRVSANLVPIGKQVWSAYHQSLVLTNTPENGGFIAEQDEHFQYPAISLPADSNVPADEIFPQWHTIRCKIDSSKFKPDTDYILSADVWFQDEEEESEITQNKLAFRVGVVNATQQIVLCPFQAPRESFNYNAADPFPRTFLLHTAKTIPTAQMYLTFVFQDWVDRVNPVRFECTYIKLEEGTIATSWVPADKDLESAIEQQAGQIAMSVKVDGEERAGLTLDEQEGITLQADKVKILNGDTLTAMFTNGILNANLLEVTKLATKADGRTRVTIGEFEDAFIRFYHTDGVTVALKLGLDYVSLNSGISSASDTSNEGIATTAIVDGSITITPSLTNTKPCVAQVFDENGQLTWVLFLTGPVTPDTQPYSWRSYSLTPASAATTAAINSKQTLKSVEYWQFKTTGSNAVEPYKNYNNYLFTKKISDSEFNSNPSAYFVPNGTYYAPEPQMELASISGSTTVWKRKVYTITNGVLKQGTSITVN